MARHVLHGGQCQAKLSGDPPLSHEVQKGSPCILNSFLPSKDFQVWLDSGSVPDFVNGLCLNDKKIDTQEAFISLS